MVEHIAAGGATASFLGIIFGVIKLIQYWLTKKAAAPTVVIENSDRHDTPGHAFTAQQVEELHTILLYTTEQKIQSEYLRSDIRQIKEGQDNLNSRISELISSSQRVIDRLTDLINAMSHKE
jgi:2-succinyl-5-enolpyruvyl-6-hydroxy-3-cyclohexene-1-carboxylate synthase